MEVAMHLRRAFAWQACLGLLILVLTVTRLISQAPIEQQLSATYSHGVVRVTIPYQAPRAGAGRLTIEILDPEDHAIGRVERAADAGGGRGVWREEIVLSKPLAIDELAWHRLRYRFCYAGALDALAEDTESVSQILRMPVLRVIGQQSYFAGGDAAVRVIVTDAHNQPVEGPSRLRVEIAPPGSPARELFAGPLNRRGTIEAQFRMPAGPVDSSSLRYTVDTPIGSAEFTETVRLEETASILLTTEKPIYQTGQTIHARALALDRANHQASANRPLTFELEDSRGNKVFKKATQTDRFGVASAEFTLADEVNLGAYHLRANSAEITITVDRYVLPKFKVTVDFASGGAAPRHGYRPGDRVTGTVRAAYFFGKPVDRAEISLKALGMDVAQFEAGTAAGKTDDAGDYRFDLALPAYFAGRSLSQGAARLVIEATVKDAAGHAETRGEPIIVSQSPLLITAIPEAGMLIPNLENQVFILTSYADGKPATAELTVSAPELPDQHVTADAGGVAIVRMNPAAGAQSLRIEARDHEGDLASTTALLDRRSGSDQILLRDERAVYRAGDRIALKVFSTRQTGSAYLDILREGQTLLTRDVDLVNGQADLTLIATPAMAGTLDLNAYVIGRDSRPVADHRLVFVQPADELKVEATADAASYKPGDDARIRFRVTNSRGEGVQAALGVQVVDEAVFALTEKQPGFAKAFFYLEQEAMKPRYEIHSIGLPEIVETAPRPQADQRDRAARALFAATELLNRNSIDREVGRTVPRTQFGAYQARYQARFDAQVKALCTTLHNGQALSSGQRDLAKAFDKLTAENSPELRDPWGVNMRAERAPWSPDELYLVRSAGPDKRFNTADDLESYLTVKTIREAAVFGRLTAQRAMAMPAMAGVGHGGGAGAGMGGVLGGVPGGVAGGVPGGLPAVRVRSYFPEALYIHPEIITDASGSASISLPLADSITTWRMAMAASTARGALGSGSSSIRVFQDFFTDLDLPVTLTQGDRVSIPVAVYNYSPSRGDVNLRLQTEDWFAMTGDSPEKTVSVDSNRVGGSQFAIEAKRIGKFKLTLFAKMGGAANRADVVVREIEIVPNGREQTQVFNGRLETSAEHAITFPADAIPEASKIYVRLYPGPLSQVIEGMDSILRMPGGCFEQTSSSAYPNTLALDYMKRTQKLTPEIHAKAGGFIASGYQRLLTFEVPGGGFSWFGNAPANKILTAYGLMEFADMAKVYDVDPRVIERTQSWLAARQQPDGSWKPDANFINEGATNSYNSDALRIAAYISWSLESSGYRGLAVEKARSFVESQLGGGNAKSDAYTLAVLANFAADYAKDRDFTHRMTQMLLDAVSEKDDQAWWSSPETPLYGAGSSAAIETTGLAVQALLKANEGSAIARKALSYLASKKDASGAWGSTQATIMALRAILLSTEKGSADTRGTVEITLNGRPARSLTLTADNNDLLHQFVLPGDAKGANSVALRFEGRGGLAYQVAGRYFLPWDARPASEPLSIRVDYDRARLAQDDIATATATVRNNMTKSVNMVMVDLGIPPGFDLLAEDLPVRGRLQKVSLAPTQAILYFDSLAAGETVVLKYRLRAKYPIRARTFVSRVYEYYDPEVNSTARPVVLEVRGK
jgi:uncharacterized protein YfaS (alpha-2-macroglobulin family)